VFRTPFSCNRHTSATRTSGNVSDRLLGLAALQWNVEKREEGPRRGTSPYSLLGVLEEADERRWWEVLLDAQEEEEKAPAQAA
jgi:hypothetical protein